MRKSVIIICAIVLAFSLWLLLHGKPKPTENNHIKIQAPSTNQLIEKQPIPQQPKVVNISSNHTTVGDIMSSTNSESEKAEEINRLVIESWQKPIEFYGKAVDENSNPVPDVDVTFGWSETPTKEGELTTTVKSDAEGLFSLHGKHGPSLDVWFSKEGYYSSHHGQRGFSYYHGDYSSTPQNPVIFVLHKKVQGVELITSQNGIRPNVWVRIPKDNTPVRVDFFQKQVSASGQLVVSQIKPPFQTATNWSFSLSIPDGGLVENQDEFQFEAPESGYQPTVEYNFVMGETNWTKQVTKQFYIVFGEPKKYGWLRIDSNLSQETVFLTYAINPTGSRNLEPK